MRIVEVSFLRGMLIIQAPVPSALSLSKGVLLCDPDGMTAPKIDNIPIGEHVVDVFFL